MALLFNDTNNKFGRTLTNIYAKITDFNLVGLKEEIYMAFHCYASEATSNDATKEHFRIVKLTCPLADFNFSGTTTGAGNRAALIAAAYTWAKTQAPFIGASDA